MTNPFKDEPIRAELADPYVSPRQPSEPPRRNRKPYPAALRMLQLACLFLLGWFVAQTPYKDASLIVFSGFVVLCIYCLGEMAIHYLIPQ